MNTDLRKNLREFEADHLWVAQNRESLLSQYPEQWIAVQNREVIASAPLLDDLLPQISDPGHTCVEFMTPEPLEMVL
jgi:hypothetical protein